MCGGIAVSNRGSICGMIEASVPDNHPQEILRNLGVIIDSKEILEYKLLLTFIFVIYFYFIFIFFVVFIILIDF